MFGRFRKNESPGRAIPGLHLKTGQVFNAHQLYRRVFIKTVENSEKKRKDPQDRHLGVLNMRINQKVIPVLPGLFSLASQARSEEPHWLEIAWPWSSERESGCERIAWFRSQNPHREYEIQRLGCCTLGWRCY